MEKSDILKQLDRILQKFDQDGISEAIEFLRVYAGEKSAFYKGISKLNPEQFWNDGIVCTARGFVQGFRNYIENDLYQGISIERRAQVDTVSDFLEQADTLLNSPGVHPAAPCMIIGASLEEFLRNWLEEADLKINGNPSIDFYAKSLRKENLINKQDYKDITSWAGLRNDAAHGKWNDVSDKNRIALMIEGVNLFIRKYIK